MRVERSNSGNDASKGRFFCGTDTKYIGRTYLGEFPINGAGGESEDMPLIGASNQSGVSGKKKSGQMKRGRKDIT